jgi:hypothetical protein
VSVICGKAGLRGREYSYYVIMLNVQQLQACVVEVTIADVIKVAWQGRFCLSRAITAAPLYHTAADCYVLVILDRRYKCRY